MISLCELIENRINYRLILFSEFITTFRTSSISIMGKVSAEAGVKYSANDSRLAEIRNAHSSSWRGQWNPTLVRRIFFRCNRGREFFLRCFCMPRAIARQIHLVRCDHKNKTQFQDVYRLSPRLLEEKELPRFRRHYSCNRLKDIFYWSAFFVSPVLGGREFHPSKQLLIYEMLGRALLDF